MVRSACRRDAGLQQGRAPRHGAVRSRLTGRPSRLHPAAVSNKILNAPDVLAASLNPAVFDVEYSLIK